MAKTNVTKPKKKIKPKKESKQKKEVKSKKVNVCNKNDCKCQTQITNMKRMLKKTLGTVKSGKTGNTKVLRKLQYMASQNAQRGY